MAEVSIEILGKGNGERKSSAGKSAAAPLNKASAAYWNIQVGAFSERKNAERCAGKIHSLGFSTIYERAGAVIRVIIPDMPSSQLDSAEKKLQANGFADYIARRAE
ncbi:MAG: SPOR domain-containing protein [Bacteroides sp.]|nr:SPOR domain-containing protein [Prevotella sp.]MCM1407580.1 SPOR domain-containing protein [Treponema brennaborense]MCM1469270.1 SPOR domain-containing protein [Bacteroides sp.]